MLRACVYKHAVFKIPSKRFLLLKILTSRKTPLFVHRHAMKKKKKKAPKEDLQNLYKIYNYTIKILATPQLIHAIKPSYQS